MPAESNQRWPADGEWIPLKLAHADDDMSEFTAGGGNVPDFTKKGEEVSENKEVAPEAPKVVLSTVNADDFVEAVMAA